MIIKIDKKILAIFKCCMSRRKMEINTGFEKAMMLLIILDDLPKNERQTVEAIFQKRANNES